MHTFTCRVRQPSIIRCGFQPPFVVRQPSIIRCGFQQPFVVRQPSIIRCGFQPPFVVRQPSIIRCGFQFSVSDAPYTQSFLWCVRPQLSGVDFSFRCLTHPTPNHFCGASALNYPVWISVFGV
ncbi:hypothetical protein [Limnospira platensis]|uniref:hypothetical protein n=2 Tax=Limnospira TaxID=2596745 RepID=UPI0001D0E964|nr:hypothetical protein [Arthrospira platensis FACHB-971]MBD2670480.1 hypothetical protein [Arthrospira platensis FACHB-439]MBD2711158.1 hypothetical protein [Arthrospira platensis FACHB-835]MDF2212331.1 hypothetical protein [Arthrospira platensis NCB002]QQW27617.1 hypothetical protein AP9108_20730 [Arthrospira sp. PCC 9108]BAI92104.1 hypothetical protein NIES39_K04590 [Arthrospira platensis NIES-39]